MRFFKQIYLKNFTKLLKGCGKLYKANPLNIFPKAKLINHSDATFYREFKDLDFIWIFPTHQKRVDKDKILDNFLSLLKSLKIQNHEYKYGFVLNIQHDEHSVEAAEMLSQRVLEQPISNEFRIAITLQKSHSKNHAINGALNLINDLSGCISHIGFVDDDISYEFGCLNNLMGCAIRNPHSVVGSSKVAHKRNNTSGRIVAALKSVLPPQFYPHGCCMLTPYNVIKNGIPSKYTSEDGFICMELIDPIETNPLGKLVVLKEAKCHHFIGTNNLKSNIQRVNRMILQHIVLVSDYSSDKANIFITKSLTSDDTIFRKKRYLICILIIHLWFLSYCIYIVYRYLIGNPLSSIAWGGNSTAQSPS